MNWKKETENELRDYQKKRDALGNIPEIVERIDYELTLMKFRQNAGSISNYKVEDIILDNIIRKSELERNLTLIHQRIDLVERGLENISCDERRILEAFYIDRPSDYIIELCKEFCCEKSSIYSRKDNALRNFVMAMYNVENYR